ncbi:hypothetical protein A1QC_14505 [Vibrio rumoiensis 1S-45]|uniref:Uncharacterized protein n=1 Tax=Vibrio rumoiensis 1S-45 TaxID=1188252 RepID=A0A1E5E4L9_9VIBR|nr:hypothetical protein A1QC_14505 [Vibrio rumoiensis 1S-45]
MSIFSIWAIIISTAPFVFSLLLISLLYSHGYKHLMESFNLNDFGEYCKVIRVNRSLNEFMIQVYLSPQVPYRLWRHQMTDHDYKQFMALINDEQFGSVWIKKEH